MLSFRHGRLTHLVTKISCSNPTCYQHFVFKPIQLPKTFAQTPPVSPKNSATHQSTNSLLIPIPLSTFLNIYPTQIPTFEFQNPPSYLQHTYPWKCRNTPRGINDFPFPYHHRKNKVKFSAEQILTQILQAQFGPGGNSINNTMMGWGPNWC